MRAHVFRIGALLLLWGCGERDDLVARSTPSLSPPPWVMEPACAADPTTLKGPSESASDTLQAFWATAGERSLCVCEQALWEGQVEVGAEDGVTIGPGGLVVRADTEVAGDLWVLGPTHASADMSLRVGADLWVGEELVGDGADFEIGGDASVGGTVSAASWTVGGEFTVPEGAVLTVENGGDTLTAQRDNVLPPPSCLCQQMPAATLDALRAEAPQITLDEVEDVVAVCGMGRFEPSSVMSQLHIAGSGLLFIDGRTAVEGNLVIAAQQGGTLDVIIAGDLHVSGALDTHADGGMVRLYVTGSGNVRLSEDSQLAGRLAMPQAELIVEEELSIRGSALMRRLFLQSGSALTLDD